MTKNIFIFLFLLLCVGAVGWIFFRKNKDVNSKDSAQLLNAIVSESPSPRVSPAVSSAPAGKPITLPNGLQMQDLVVGTGTEAHTGDVVSVNYIGTLVNGQKFDSSYDHGQAFLFPLGAGQVIKGWDIGVVGMRIGGKRKLIVPPNLGYGAQGAGGVIPPNATLIFEVELLDLRSSQK